MLFFDVTFIFISVHQPIRYGFEAILTNEFRTLNGTCSTLVPRGAGYENVTIDNQVCTAVGSQAGESTVDGNTFVQLSYGYSFSNLWRVSRLFI
jgi:ATP-binding cassette, subfamily G (WHITE), member 2, SNQ2